MHRTLPIVIGISGISGSGKSTLTKKLAKTLQATFILWDDYDEISQSPHDYVQWYNSGKNYDDWVYDDLVKTLEGLKEGHPVNCPATRKELYPTEYILFDAPLGYCHRATGKAIDFLVCLDTPPDIALARRLLRDFRNCLEPKEIPAELDLYLTRSRPLYILTSEEKACDLLIDGSLPLEEQEQFVLTALRMLQENKGKPPISDLQVISDISGKKS